MDQTGQQAFFLPLGYRRCDLCGHAKPEAVYHGSSKVCPSCNASRNIQAGEQAVAEAEQIIARAGEALAGVPASVTTPTKQCKKCGDVKPTTEFGRNRATKDFLQAYCKPCQNAAERAAYARNRAAAAAVRESLSHQERGAVSGKNMTPEDRRARAIKESAARWEKVRAAEVKVCSKCKREKPRTEYHKNGTSPDGLA